MTKQQGAMIAFEVDGAYIKLHGPFPSALTSAADCGLSFMSLLALFEWLDEEWPRWRDYIVELHNV